MEKRLLDDIPGGDAANPNTDTQGELRKRIEQGRRLGATLREMLERNKRGDRLVSAKEFYELYSNRDWCPDSTKAVAIKLKRKKLTPINKGHEGRGHAHHWWRSDVLAALNPKAQKKKR
ncbi:MAG: hypothetical protein HS116_12350 [Planctomycetes bacterium]|nr:hypothetical protein [Planctomycetota bacterium]